VCLVCVGTLERESARVAFPSEDLFVDGFQVACPVFVVEECCGSGRCGRAECAFEMCVSSVVVFLMGSAS